MYQIKLFSQGEIEIFNNVLKHETYIENHTLMAIKIEYGQEGCSTTSIRSLSDVYDIHIKDESELVNRPVPCDIKIITHG